MELGTKSSFIRAGGIVAIVTSVCIIKYVVELFNEDFEMLEAIIENDDNLSYGVIFSVYTGDDEFIMVLTDDGIEELKDMLRDAC